MPCELIVMILLFVAAAGVIWGYRQNTLKKQCEQRELNRKKRGL